MMLEGRRMVARRRIVGELTTIVLTRSVAKVN